MKGCLNCKKEYDNKRDASKFCSAKCRVMYNRKNPKKTITPVQMQVLYNAVLDALASHKENFPQDFQNIKSVGILKENGTVEPLSFDKMKAEIAAKDVLILNQREAKKLMGRFWSEKRELSADDYPDWLERLNNSPLSTKQKELIKNTYQ